MEKTRKQIAQELEETIDNLDGLCGMIGAIWEIMDMSCSGSNVKAIGAIHNFMGEQLVTLHKVIFEDSCIYDGYRNDKAK